MTQRSFARLSVAVLCVNLFVIVWGGFVRASKSGAGCGAHWPTCDGQVLPRPRSVEMAIELTHRLTSGAALLLVVAMLVFARRLYPPGALARRGATATMVFMVIESLVGAGLVLLRLVGDNSSALRAWYLAVHLTNTFMLMSALGITVWGAFGGRAPSWNARPRASVALGVGFVGTLLVAITGAITALGDTLFHARTLAEGIAQDLDPSSHFLIRLRVFHPLMAFCVSFYLVMIAWAVRHGSAHRAAGTFASALTVLFVVQLGLGGVNLMLRAPVWMQLVHLFVADLVWMSLVFFAASALEPELNTAA